MAISPRKPKRPAICVGALSEGFRSRPSASRRWKALFSIEVIFNFHIAARSRTHQERCRSIAMGPAKAATTLRVRLADGSRRLQRRRERSAAGGWRERTPGSRVRENVRKATPRSESHCRLRSLDHGALRSTPGWSICRANQEAAAGARSGADVIIRSIKNSRQLSCGAAPRRRTARPGRRLASSWRRVNSRG